MTVPSRNQLRRELHRLAEVIDRQGDRHPSLQILRDQVHDLVARLEARWSAATETSVRGAKERGERDLAQAPLVGWYRLWRRVVMLRVPGVAEVRELLPARSTTRDGAIRHARSLVELIETDEAAASFRTEALGDLGDALARFEAEHADAVEVLREEHRAQEALREVLAEAQPLLRQAKGIVRGVLGPTSPEYRSLLRSGGRGRRRGDAASAGGVAPVAPVAPVEPVEPAEPVEPVEPAAPVEPVEPVEPVAPKPGYGETEPEGYGTVVFSDEDDGASDAPAAAPGRARPETGRSDGS